MNSDSPSHFILHTKKFVFNDFFEFNAVVLRFLERVAGIEPAP